MNSIRKGMIWTLFGQAAELISGGILVFFLANMLGAEKYGVLETVLAILYLISLFNDFGISSSTSKYVAELNGDSDKQMEIVVSASIARILLMIPFAIITIICLPYISTFLGIGFLGENNYLLIVLLFLRSIREMIYRIYQGYGRLDLRSKLIMIYSSSLSVTTVILLFYGAEIYAIIAAEIVAIVIVIFITLLDSRRKFPFRQLFRHFSRQASFKVLQYAFPMFAVSLSYYIYMKTDILMIQYFLGSADVGLYALAVLVISKAQIPLIALGASAAPLFASGSTDVNRRRFAHVFRISFIISLVLAIGIFVISDPFINMFFGREYQQTIPILKGITVFFFFHSFNAVLCPILDYLGYAKWRAILSCIAAVSNFGLNIYMIPKFGVMGAVYSTAITYSLYSLCVIYQSIKACMGNKPSLLFSIRGADK